MSMLYVLNPGQLGQLQLHDACSCCQAGLINIHCLIARSRVVQAWTPRGRGFESQCQRGRAGLSDFPCEEYTATRASTGDLPFGWTSPFGGGG